MATLGRIQGTAMERGISPSMPNDEGLVWRYSQNAVFLERSVQPALGQNLILVGNGKRVSDLLTNRVDRTPTLFYGAEDELGLWTEQNGGALLNSGYSESGDWSLESWGSHVVATNGIDPMQYWAGAGVFQDLAGMPYVSNIVVRRSPFLIVMGTQLGGNHIAWCDEDDVNEWSPAADNLAGDINVRDVDSDIIAALPYGGEILFYTSDTVHSLNFLGAPYVFGEQFLFEGIGPVGKHAVCLARHAHFGISRRGIFRVTSGGYDIISRDLVHDYIYDDFSDDESLLANAVAYNDEVEEMVFFFYPSGSGSCNDRCIAFNYRTGSWQPMTTRREAAVNVSAFPFGITADVSGNIFYQQTKSLNTNQNLIGLSFPGDGGLRVGYGNTQFGAGPFNGTQSPDLPTGVETPRGDATVIVEDFLEGTTKRLTTLAAPAETITLESKDLDLGSFEAVKELDRVEWRFDPRHSGDDEATGVEIGECFGYIGSRNSINEEHVWLGPYDLANSEMECLQLEGVFFRIKLEAVSPLVRWKLSSVDFYGEVVAEEAAQCQADTGTSQNQLQQDTSSGRKPSLVGSSGKLGSINLSTLNW